MVRDDHIDPEAVNEAVKYIEAGIHLMEQGLPLTNPDSLKAAVGPLRTELDRIGYEEE